MPAVIDSLAEIETALWHELAAAADDPEHPWRLAVLATVDGAHPEARLVVLREVDAGAKQLRFYTDARSAKVRQIALAPLGTLVFWSGALGWQLRARARLMVEASGLAVSSRWARLNLTPAAQDYLSPLPPGSILAPAPAPAPEPDRGSRTHFALLSAELGAIDWLELRATGQRRAWFDETGARWVAP